MAKIDLRKFMAKIGISVNTEAEYMDLLKYGTYTNYLARTERNLKAELKWNKTAKAEYDAEPNSHRAYIHYRDSESNIKQFTYDIERLTRNIAELKPKVLSSLKASKKVTIEDGLDRILDYAFSYMY